MWFIIESGFKSRASYNSVCMVYVVETLDTVHGGLGKEIEEYKPLRREI